MLQGVVTVGCWEWRTTGVGGAGAGGGSAGLDGGGAGGGGYPGGGGSAPPRREQPDDTQSPEVKLARRYLNTILDFAHVGENGLPNKPKTNVPDTNMGFSSQSKMQSSR